MTTLAQLDRLLERDIAATRLESGRQWDARVGDAPRQLVLHGAGGLGRKTLQGLRRVGLEPVAFSDNGAREPGVLDGVPVLPTRSAIEKHGRNALFVVTIYVGTDAVVADLRQKGCTFVQPFYPLYWKHPELFLPHYACDLPHRLLEHRQEVRRVADLISDPLSVKEYVAQVQWRLDPETAAGTHLSVRDIYFPSDIVKLSDHEVLVDCGAYTGDTLQDFLKQVGSRFGKVFALEPDPRNLESLKKRVSALPSASQEKIAITTCAVGDATSTLRFSMRSAASAVSIDGEIEVPCRRLDDVLAGEKASFVKMDIEGAELAALAGCAEQIRCHQPLLAISAYHQPDDFWRIPQLIHSIHPGYAYHLRRYSPNYVDNLVVYAVPPSHQAG